MTDHRDGSAHIRRVIRQARAGKAAVLNTGIAVAAHAIVVLDATPR